MRGIHESNVEKIFGEDLLFAIGANLGSEIRGADSGYSMMTVDCPVNSNRLRQRMFLQAIMSSFRTM